MPRLPASQRLLLATAIAGIFVLPGCNRAREALAEQAIDQARGESMDFDTHGFKTGKIVALQDRGSVTLPADFPVDVFLPEQRTVSSAMDMDGTKAVNIATAAAMRQVSADMEKTMQEQGWKREMSMQSSADSSTLIFSKDNRQTVYQLVKAEDGGTQLAVRTGSEG